jgi:hypothetical protein
LIFTLFPGVLVKLIQCFLGAGSAVHPQQAASPPGTSSSQQQQQQVSTRKSSPGQGEKIHYKIDDLAVKIYPEMFSGNDLSRPDR